MTNTAQNRYLAQQLDGIELSDFDGNGGFWAKARALGIPEHQINSLIAGFQRQADPVTGMPRAEDAAANLGLGPSGGSATLGFDYEAMLDQVREGFSRQLGDYSNQITDLNAQIAGQAALGSLFGGSEFDPLISARYLNAGRSRRSVTSTTSGGSSSGLSF